MSINITNQKQMVIWINKFFNKKSSSREIKKKMKLIGRKVLDKTYKEIEFFL